MMDSEVLKIEEIQIATDLEHDTVKRVVEEEGIGARNLLNFIADGSIEGSKTLKKPPVSPRPQSASPRPLTQENGKESKFQFKRHTAISRPKNRLRSVSAGRNPEKDLRARYWTFLFENLHRAVDEIYQTCEMDESIVESKEAIMMLENYSKDFHALIQWLNISKSYEKTAPPNRPQSLAWDVRKSSPGKSFLKSIFIEKLTAGSSQAKKVLCFDSPSETKSVEEKIDSEKATNSKSKSNDDVPKIENEELHEIKDAESTENKCDAKISFHVSSETIFPCNKDLVIQEVQCLSDNTVGESNLVSIGEDIEQNKMIPDSGDDSTQPLTKSVGTETKYPPEKKAEKRTIAIQTDGVYKSLKVGNPPAKVGERDLADFPEISKAIGCKNRVSKALPPTKVASQPVHSPDVSSATRSASSSAQVKTLKVRKDDEGKQPLKKSEQTSVSRAADTPKSVKPTVLGRTTLVRSKTLTSNLIHVANKQNAEVQVMTTPSSADAVKRTARKPESEKRAVKTENESFIKKNVMNVKNITPKISAESVQRQAPSRAVSHAIKPPQKSGSMPSFSSIYNRRNFADKAKASSSEHIVNVGSKANNKSKEDSDGWETVRGRTRCRNSPAKKLPSESDKKINHAAQIAKLNQSRIGGFPYTTKTNAQTPVKNGKKPAEKKAVLDVVELKENDPKILNNTVKPDAKETEIILKKIADETSDNNKVGSDVKLNNAINKKNSSAEKKILVTDPKSIKSEKNPKSVKIIRQLKESLSLPLRVKFLHSYEKSFDLPKPKTLKKSTSLSALSEQCDKDALVIRKTQSDGEDACEDIDSIFKIDETRKIVFDKFSNFSRKRSKKISRLSNIMSNIEIFPNSCQCENDDGLMSDNQCMVHEEEEDDQDMFDIHTQELYDTTWKYKILEQQVLKFEELHWNEDTLDMELRTPGRALEMHEKLSSPFRKKSLVECTRKCKEKHLKAQEYRERSYEEKAQKFKDMEKKRQEMKTLSEKRQEQQRVIIEQRLQRAEIKRKQLLEKIIKKAHDEEEKVNEISFINTLEAENKRHDLISKEKDHEARLQDIQDERQRKQEEKAAKEAAAEERRKIIEADRVARLSEMQEKRKLKDLKIEQQFLEKEKERQEMANQKAREREQRISAMNAAQQINIEELQKKIQFKQEESARRHEENIEQIRLKAFELSVRRCSSNNDDAPQPVPYETKKICTMCNVLIGSEVYLLSHLRGKEHQEMVKDQHQGQDPSTEELELYNLKHIVDASTHQLDPNIALDKERQKALKKRCKKLRQRMSNRGMEYESQLKNMPEIANSNMKTKVEKIINDINKLALGNGPCDNALLTSCDRLLDEMERHLIKGFEDQRIFCVLGGIGGIVNLLYKISGSSNENNAFMLKKTLNHASQTVERLVQNGYESSHHILYSNKIGSLLDILICRLNILIPDNYNQLIANSTKSSTISLPVDQLASRLLHLLSCILIHLAEPKNNRPTFMKYSNDVSKEKMEEEFHQWIHSIISYIISIGIVDKLSQYFNSIQGQISYETEVASFLLDCIAFLTALIRLFTDGLEHKKQEDTTQLIATFKVTNMMGAVSLLYGLLLHNGASSRDESPPVQLPKHTVDVAYSTLCMLNYMAVMNLQAFQNILGSEDLSLQLRHISSHLLWYCNHWTSDLLLNEVILLVGYFTVLNPENQLMIQAGQRPTVLQQLCSLPFLYFSDSELTDILFPTLISCCCNSTSNRTILEQEMSSELLSNYIEAQFLNAHDVYSQPNKSKFRGKRWLFPTRFPKERWSSAKDYFSIGAI